MRAAIERFLQRHLFRWRTDAAGTIRLGQRRVFILPTRGGLLFAATLLAMLLAAINYALALGHALVFLLGGLCLTGMIHTFRNLHGLRLTAIRCPPVFAGETALCEIVVENDDAHERRAIELACADRPPSRCDIPAQGRSLIRVILPAARRGEHAVPRIRLQTVYPLGLFTAWAYLQPPLHSLVYPTPLLRPLPPARAHSDGGQGQHQEGQEDFAGLRQRQPADPMRHVAWKASARDDGERPLLAKQFAGGDGGELQLDWQQAEPAAGVETRLSILSGWLLQADAAGLPYSLALPHTSIPAAAGPAQLERCLGELARYPG